jgi:hypothetical protein
MEIHYLSTIPFVIKSGDCLLWWPHFKLGRYRLRQNKTNSMALSPQANYTDWATATCQRNLVPTFVDRGVSRGERGESPTVANISFLDRSRYFSFKYLFIYPHKGWVDPIPDTLLLRKSISAGNRTRNLSVSSQELCMKILIKGHCSFSD